METYQLNSEFPLTPAQFQRMQQEVIREAQRTLIGRRIFQVYGPLGAGIESISYETFDKDEMAEIDLLGKKDARAIEVHPTEVYRRVPILYKDFLMHWRDVKLSKDLSSPLDVTHAVRAAHFVADREDDLIFNGHKKLEIEGLLTVPGRSKIKKGSWEKIGNAFADIVRATEALLKQNHHRPYALALSPKLYADLLRAKESGYPVLEMDQVMKLCTDGVFQSPSIPENTAVVVSTGDQNFDIAVTEDLSVAYLGPESMNYHFRIYESLVLRIKRATAICTLEE